MKKTASTSYNIYGSGDPVLLVHGFGEDSRIWENQVRKLSDSFQLIVPDIPGSGLSPMLDKGSMEIYAGCLKEILDQENINEAHLIGHSMGGYISMAFAELFPEKLKSLVLFHSTSYADDAEKINTRKKGIEFIRQHGAKKFLEQAIPNLFSEQTRKEKPELLQEILERYTNFSDEALVQYYEAMIARPDRREVLKNIDKPVMFIAGKYDSTIPLEKVLEQAHLPSFSYIHICKHSGHMGMLEEMEESNTSLEKFLKSQ